MYSSCSRCSHIYTELNHMTETHFKFIKTIVLPLQQEPVAQDLYSMYDPGFGQFGY